MAPKRPKKKNVRSSSSQLKMQNSQSSQVSLVSEASQATQTTQAIQSTQATHRNRAKKYTTAESEALLKICNEFHGIINKNSNRDADRKNKDKAWATIKRTFDTTCKSQAIFVRFV